MALRNDLNAQVKADLTNFSSAIDGQAYILLGESAMGDRTFRVYYYDASSSVTADGDNVLTPTGMGGTGRFIKIKVEEFNPAAQVNSDWNSVSGISEILNKPSLKKQETFSGTTNSSGNYTVTFGTAYSVAPNIQANIIGGSNTNLIKITSVSTTGFTVNVVNRVDVIGLLPTYNNVNGASVDVLITEK